MVLHTSQGLCRLHLDAADFGNSGMSTACLAVNLHLAFICVELKLINAWRVLRPQDIQPEYACHNGRETSQQRGRENRGDGELFHLPDSLSAWTVFCSPFTRTFTERDSFAAMR
jgi:hypothetical protein